MSITENSTLLYPIIQATNRTNTFSIIVFHLLGINETSFSKTNSTFFSQSSSSSAENYTFSFGIEYDSQSGSVFIRTQVTVIDSLNIVVNPISEYSQISNFNFLTNYRVVIVLALGIATCLLFMITGHRLDQMYKKIRTRPQSIDCEMNIKSSFYHRLKQQFIHSHQYFTIFYRWPNNVYTRPQRILILFTSIFGFFGFNAFLVQHNLITITTISYVPIGFGVSLITIPFTAILRQFFVKSSMKKLQKLYTIQKREDSLQDISHSVDLSSIADYSTPDYTVEYTPKNESMSSPDITPPSSLRYLNNYETGFAEGHEMKSVSTFMSGTTVSEVTLESISSIRTDDSDWIRTPREKRSPKATKKSIPNSKPKTTCSDLVIRFEKCSLPKVFRYIAYLVCFLWCAFFIFIILLYGIIYEARFDNWMLVSLTAVLADIIVVQPVKVFILVLFKECIFPRSKVPAMKSLRNESGLL